MRSREPLYYGLNIVKTTSALPSATQKPAAIRVFAGCYKPKTHNAS